MEILEGAGLILVLIGMICFPEAVLGGAKQSLLLAGQTVIPSLFPFFVLSGVLTECGTLQKISRAFEPVMKPIFGVSGSGALPLFLGLISGYPLGASSAAELYRNGALGKRDYERLLAYCNNAGPMFLVGTVGMSVFGNRRAGWILLAAHALSAVLTGIFVRFLPLKEEAEPTASPASPAGTARLFSVLPDVMERAVKNMLTVTGYIVLFGALISLMEATGILSAIGRLFPFAPDAMSRGLFEMTAGVLQLSKMRMPLRILLPVAGLLVGFGGLSVHLQTAALLKKNAFLPYTYWLGKVMSALFTAGFTVLILRFFPTSAAVFRMLPVEEFPHPWMLTLMLCLWVIVAMLFLLILVWAARWNRQIEKRRK